MTFEMNDRVVYPAFGVGRIVGLTAKTVGAAASQMYYEVSGDRTTAWVQVDEGEGSARLGVERQRRAMDGSLYDGGNLVASGPYSLSAETPPLSGSIQVSTVGGLLNRGFLTLQLANGERLNIIPRRVEHSAGR